MPLTPQQRAQLAQKDSYYLLMPLELGHPHSVAAHTRKMAQLLRGDSPSPCGDAVQHLVKLYDRSAQPDPAIACRKGCSHCCSQEVSVTAPEAFHVAAQLQGRAPTAAVVAEAAARTAGLAPAQRWRDWPKCPLLVDRDCSIYAARPLGCHAFVSVDLQACITAFDTRSEPNIPTPRSHSDLLQACRMAFYAALRVTGLSEHAYELNRAVHAVLAIPDAETRWLKGEDVLAGLETPTTLPPVTESEITALSGFVAPTL